MGPGRTLSTQSLRLVIVALHALVMGCTSKSSSAPSSTPSPFPLGQAVSGVTLAGELAGKTMYLLPVQINLTHCWKDSVYWDGTQLLLGLSALSYTGILATSPSYAADPGCTVPSSHQGVNTNFNVYSAVASGGVWSLTNLGVNSSTYALAAPKLSGTTLVAVDYTISAPKTQGGYIYFATQTGTNSWSGPTAFAQNATTCTDDNPAFYSAGSKLIFESNRQTGAVGASCNTGNHQKLWTSTLSAGVWSTPTSVTGAPSTLGAQALQPWVNDVDGTLYWTGDSSACGGSVMNCVLSAPSSGAGWSNAATQILTPTPLTSGADGKVVLVGQFTKANGFAVMACGLATDTDPTASTPSLIGSRWTIVIGVCAVPL